MATGDAAPAAAGVTRDMTVMIHRLIAGYAVLGLLPGLPALVQQASVISPVWLVPTLILHARDERLRPFADAEELADLVPGSRLVALDSRNHILQAEEPAFGRFLDEVEAFLATHREIRARPGGRP